MKCQWSDCNNELTADTAIEHVNEHVGYKRDSSFHGICKWEGCDVEKECRSKLFSHAISHIDMNFFTCECGKDFKRKSDLVSHQIRCIAFNELRGVKLRPVMRTPNPLHRGISVSKSAKIEIGPNGLPILPKKGNGLMSPPALPNKQLNYINTAKRVHENTHLQFHRKKVFCMPSMPLQQRKPDFKNRVEDLLNPILQINEPRQAPSPPNRDFIDAIYTAYPHCEK